MVGKSKTGLGWPGFAVVLIVTVAVVFIALRTMNKYTEAKDVVAVLGAIVSPLAGIGAAAFGIKLSSDAKAETKEVKKKASDLADSTRELRGSAAIETRGPDDSTKDLLTRIEAELRRVAE